MLDPSREAVAIAKGKTRDDLRTDRILNLALVRLLEIVGEAASRTPLDERAQRSEHPMGPDCRTAQPADSWLRFKSDFEILWQIVNSDLPNLIAKLGQIVSPA